MLICRTPFRISFFGGGTDYPIWYQSNKGQVISTTINKYSYINARWLPPFFDYKYRIRYFKQEYATMLDDIHHPSVRESIRYLCVNGGLDLVHNADLPAQSGLGSSSTFTVGMLHSLYTLKNYMPTKRELALEAIHVEQNIIGEFVGSQDQASAAFGGLNHIKFNSLQSIDVDPVIISKERSKMLEENLLLCFTGFARTASTIADHQIKSTKHKYNELNSINQLTEHALSILTNEKVSIDEFGSLLDEQWKIKRSLTKFISNKRIDHMYDAGLASGALGGKLLGAGGGGFMLFYAPKERHKAIKKSLDEKMFVPFRFESTGSKIVYFTH
ncbi:D-glycero-alpha-D-manno-heptose 7-phosphate kinase [Prochlorococcus marinus str. MIT 1342]|uniref:GHMP family kinase ATP-binding protein n=1 Tax=Prochlorococcus TaxID=1218 RepID=UPI0007B3981B|nr:kinase [Prochlorococcus marinus]KZR79934.1 D-glycero-alpha-D-manno-heptose 7-phosphate kinase [Prochlorococcus marinus str. MIT 1342]